MGWGVRKARDDGDDVAVRPNRFGLRRDLRVALQSDSWLKMGNNSRYSCLQSELLPPSLLSHRRHSLLGLARRMVGIYVPSDVLGERREQRHTRRVLSDL